MNRIHRTRRSVAVLAVLAVALLASALSASAASARLEPLPGPSGGSAPAPVQVITLGGMPGWQIASIAVGAALVAAVAAVLLDRARMARRVTAAPS
jgi:hypothetical protein